MKKILIISLLIFAIFIVSCTNAIEDSMEVEGDHNDEETTDTEVESAQLTEDADPGTAETIVEQDELADADTRTESDESTIEVIELTASNWEFEVTSADEIHEGDTVQIKVTGTQGSHGLKFEDLDVAISSIKSGDTETVEFIAPAAGDYRYYCSIFCGSGHSSMDGILVVLG